MLALTIAARVDENGIVTLQVPPQVSPGYHKMIVVIEETSLIEKTSDLQGSGLTEQEITGVLPTYNVGPWPENFSLRREDLYDDWGR